MAKPATSPIKVTVHMMDGRLNSADGVVMLDGILYHAWFLKHAPHVLDGNGREKFDGFFGLPLRQTPYGYAASRAVYTELGREIEMVNKRQDFFKAAATGYLDQDKGLLSSSVGQYRNYRMPYVIRIIAGGTLTFWAMSHADEVRELLDMIPAVGKKNAIGYGQIDRCEVEECAEDYSLWHPKHGLMRPVPVDSDEAAGLDLSRYPVMMYATKPPYWKDTNLRMCYVPVEGSDGL